MQLVCVICSSIKLQMSFERGKFLKVNVIHVSGEWNTVKTLWWRKERWFPQRKTESASLPKLKVKPSLLTCLLSGWCSLLIFLTATALSPSCWSQSFPKPSMTAVSCGSGFRGCSCIDSDLPLAVFTLFCMDFVLFGLKRRSRLSGWGVSQEAGRSATSILQDELLLSMCCWFNLPTQRRKRASRKISWVFQHRSQSFVEHSTFESRRTSWMNSANSHSTHSSVRPFRAINCCRHCT